MRRRLGILSIVVFCSVAVAAQDLATAPDYYVEVFLDNPNPYLGQQITYTFRFYDAVGVLNPDYEPPDFEGLWQISDGQIQTSVRQINNRQYTVSELNTALYPTRVGDIALEPGHVVLPETVYRSEVEMATDSLIVQVQPLPEGAPVDFSGGVGQFELSAALDRQSSVLGEPITLKLSVTGSGNVEQLSLSAMPLPGQWRIYENPTSFTSKWLNGQVVGEKIYEYLLFPDAVGSQTLPSVTLGYFDPITNSYRSISTVPVTIEILPSLSLPIQPIAASEPPTILSLKPIPKNLQNPPIYPSPIFWLLWFFPPLVAALCTGYLVRQKQQRKGRDAARNLRALFVAKNQLHSAKSMPIEKGYALARKTMIGYLETKLNRGHLRGEHPDLQSILDDSDLPSSIKESVIACFSWIDEGQYAPITPQNLALLVSRIEETLQVIDNQWSQP